ncbi:MAG: hypothetical protein COT00_04910 [Candidatus Omnitrophica bacterium CG07_land_8_20_14_0_80_50_8]|nr:MAG: hypothetical protein AUJ71_03210 [Candidatus Omnitrophica bacterium CG1_02_49_16]PIU39832.1 MAG: hypothetical protein COT00_04910 [Candidatus Omnitrophica bacterium CG07_land_8_20_14_0_80_50_8]
MLDIELVVPNGIISPEIQRVLSTHADLLNTRTGGFVVFVKPTLAEKPNYISVIQTLNELGIQVVVADSFEEIRSGARLGSKNVTFTVKRTPETLKTVGTLLGTNRRDVYAMVDPRYDLQEGVVWLSIAASQMAHEHDKSAVAVWDLNNLDPQVKEFFAHNDIYVYVIAKVWQYLKDMFRSVHASAVAA